MTHEQEVSQFHDPMDHAGRVRVADTCGTCDESLSLNLGRGQQEEATRTDGVGVRVEGNAPPEEWQCGSQKEHDL